MKRITLLYFLAGTLLCGATSLVAGPTGGTNQAPSALHRNPEARADNARVLQIVGLTRVDLKGLAPADRREKLKTAVKGKISELKQKQSSGTITPEETSDLTFLEKHQRRGGKKHEKTGNDSQAVPPVQQAPQTQAQ